MDNIAKALKDFKKSIEDLTEATNRVSKTQKVIDEAITKEIEERKKEAEDLLKRIKF